MEKLNFKRTALRTATAGSVFLRGLAFTLCFIAIAAVTSHLFQHCLAGSSANLAACKVCGQLSNSAATASIHIPAPPRRHTLSAEYPPERVTLHRAPLNTGRSPPFSA